jgi:sugar/nucleoside kinase (ribokinase family)
MPRMRQDAVVELFAAAHRAGAKTVLDVAVSGPGDYLAQLERVLPHTDVFLPNHDEGAQICGTSDVLRQAQQFHRLGAGTVVITCGGNGSVLVNDRVRLRAGTYPVEYVDGTGCGDAFDAGFIFGLLHDLSTEDSLRYATALGASCVRAVGTTTGVFTRNECETFIRQHALRIESL